MREIKSKGERRWVNKKLRGKKQMENGMAKKPH